jgi:uncharacterized repeat protein (TIGR01451 family)
VLHQSLSITRGQRLIAVALAFLLAVAFSPMVLATGPAQSQIADAADVELIMDVNGVFPSDAALVYSGGILKYTITVTNHGPGAAPGAKVSGGIVPWAATFTSADPSVGTYVDSSGFGTWTIGTLTPGATETLSVYATAMSVTEPQVRIQNSANVRSDVSDPNPGDAGKNAFFTILPGAAPDVDLEATKFVDNDTQTRATRSSTR